MVAAAAFPSPDQHFTPEQTAGIPEQMGLRGWQKNIAGVGKRLESRTAAQTPHQSPSEPG